MDIYKENKRLNNKIQELEKKLNVLVSTFQYTGDNTPVHDKLKKEVELYKSMLDNEKFIAEQLRKENTLLKEEIERLKQWQQNPRKSGRHKREFSEKGIEILSAIKLQLDAGNTNLQIMNNLHLSESTYYRYKKILKREKD